MRFIGQKNITLNIKFIKFNHKIMSNNITVTSTVNANSKKTWDYYTNPEHVTKWNFADPSWVCPSASNDLRVGGKTSSRMEARDGSFGFDFEGTYIQVIDGQKLVYKLDDGREVAVSFTTMENGTNVTVIFEAEKETPVEMQRGGWQAILDNFKRYIES
jgi:uncharacterized protein YndB with AHSA1/START domain